MIEINDPIPFDNMLEILNASRSIAGKPEIKGDALDNFLSHSMPAPREQLMDHDAYQKSYNYFMGNDNGIVKRTFQDRWKGLR